MYANGCYMSIFSFGDSVADTENIKQIASISHTDVESLRWPYGETFFHQPTGRASNGRLLIDFLAESLGLPLISPFLHDKEDDKVVEFRQRVNYAVVAATALDTLFHEARDCRNLIGRSLILMGEIGGTDYNNPIVNNKPINELNSYIPLVIDIIISAVNVLINMGAQTLVVPGTFPIGCSDRLNFDDWKEQRLAHCSFDVLTHVDNTTPKTTDVEWKKIDVIVKFWTYGTTFQNLWSMF
uniref:GDSL esterase/lipase n=1 Tax=Lactuca sativa TaxID=4236 RepID=A0A9R1X1H0_LACSA|nr:hypothetical protein LSAT_V11C800451740 [Lactuca sativa]